MRQLQVYALVGAILPPQPVIELIDSYIRNLNEYRKEWLRKSH
jgi:hypothetical protein